MFDYIHQELSDLYARRAETHDERELAVIDDAILCVREELMELHEDITPYICIR